MAKVSPVALAWTSGVADTPEIGQPAINRNADASMEGNRSETDESTNNPFRASNGEGDE